VLFFKRRILNIYLQREIEDPFKQMHRANNPQKLDARSLCSKFIKVAFYFIDLVHTLFVQESNSSRMRLIIKKQKRLDL